MIQVSSWGHLGLQTNIVVHMILWSSIKCVRPPLVSSLGTAQSSRPFSTGWHHLVALAPVDLSAEVPFPSPWCYERSVCLCRGVQDAVLLDHVTVTSATMSLLFAAHCVEPRRTLFGKDFAPALRVRGGGRAAQRPSRPLSVVCSRGRLRGRCRANYRR